jgi:hypothetical protein
MFKKPNLV